MEENSPSTTQNPSSPSFEEALQKLESIVSQLENGGLPLEDSMKAFEEGMKLNALCAAKLKEAESKIEKLVRLKEDGSLTWEPYEP